MSIGTTFQPVTISDADGNPIPLGQSTATASLPVVIATDQSLVPISDGGGSITIDGTLTANIGTTNGLALNATLTGGTQTTRITDGTNTITVKAASTAPVAGDTALVVTISPNSSVNTTSPSIGTNNSTIPGSSTQIGGSDGTNLQSIRVFDGDTGAGTQYVLGAILRKSASGGTVEAGTSADPLRIDPTGTTIQPVSDGGGSLTVDGTITANIGTTNGLALNATLTGGTQTSRITDGTNTVTVKATSTAAVAGDQALVVAISPNNTVAISASSLPLPTGAATETTLSAINTKTLAAGQATMAASYPVVIASNQTAIPVTDNGGSLTVDGTVTANIGTTNGLALDVTLTGGTQKSIVRGGAKGATTAADVTSTAEGADHQALDIQIYHGGVAKDPTAIRALTSSDVVTAAQGTAAALSGYWTVRVTDGTNTMPTGDTVGRAIFEKITDGTNTAVVKAASTAAVAGDSALVVAISPNNSVAITASSLPLPTGAATETTLASRLADSTFTGRINTLGQKTMANSTPVVISSDQSAITVTGTVTATNPSVGSNNSAIPGSSTQIGGSDGTNLQSIRVFDGDTGAGTQYVLGAILRKSASGGTVEAGTSADPLRIDPTGTTTQPVTGIVTANIGTTNGLALDATLTGGTQRSKITDGTNNAAVKAASTAAAATDPALVVSISPNNSVAITASSLPLPTGAATETTLASRLADSTFTGRINTLGQKTMANSTPIVIASDQSTIAISASSLPLPAGASTSAKQPALGTAGTASTDVITIQGIASMVALKVDGSGVTQPISGTVTANIGTTNGLALDATLTGGTQRSKITDGTNNAAVKAASTAAVATDPALVVAISPNNTVAVTQSGTWTNAVTQATASNLNATIVGLGTAGTPSGGVVSIQGVSGGQTVPISGTVTATNPSVSTNNSTIPGSSTQMGGSDGTNLQSIRVFDGDTGAGTQYVLGAILRKSASGGTVEAGTSADPLRIDPTGTTTQPISAASLPLPTGAATETTLASRLADSTFTSRINTLGQKTMANSTPVVIASDQSSFTVTANIGTTNGLALNATLTGGTQTTRVTDGTNTAAVKAASTAAVAADPALVVAISPNSSITATNPSVSTNNSAIPGSSTQIGGSDGTNLQSIRVFDGDTGAGTQYVLGAILRKSASGGTVEAGTSADPLRIDPTGTTTQPVSAASLPLPTGAATSANQTIIGNQTTKLNDGTNTAAVKAASTAPVATDPALVVAISPNSSLTATNPSVSTNNVAIPGSSTQIGGSDGTNLRSIRVFDGDTGAGTQYVLGAIIRKSASGGTVEAGTSTDPLRIDPTGTTTQPITGTVTANIGTTNGLALDATLTGNNQRTRITDGTTLVAVKAASTAAVAADPALVVAISPNNPIVASNPSVSATGSAPPAQATSIGGSVTTAAPSYTTGQLNFLSLTTTGNLRVDGSSVTQPVSAASLPLPTGAATETTLTAINTKTLAAGQATMAASSPVVIASNQTAIPVTDNGGSLTVDGTVTANQGTAAALSGNWPVRVTDGTNAMPTGDAVSRAIFYQISDGTTGPVAVKAASTAPVVGDRALVVVLSPNQPAIPTTTSPLNSTPLLSMGDVALSSVTTAAIRRTAYTEQTTNFTGSVSSNNAADAAAGTGMRSLRITWMDSTGATVGTEDVTLNGTTPVNLVTTTKCFIDKIEGLTWGTGGANAGIISLFTGAAGGGTLVGTIAATDNRTFWAHHYIQSGKTGNVTSVFHGNNSTVSGGTSVAVLKRKNIVANSGEVQISDFIRISGAVNSLPRNYGSVVQVTGPARIVMYVTTSSATSITYTGSFDSYDA
jgi:hypothetical protein